MNQTRTELLTALCESVFAQWSTCQKLQLLRNWCEAGYGAELTSAESRSIVHSLGAPEEQIDPLIEQVQQLLQEYSRFYAVRCAAVARMEETMQA